MKPLTVFPNLTTVLFTSPSSLPPPRDTELITRLRHANKYPIPFTKTKRFCSFINFTLSNYVEWLFIIFCVIYIFVISGLLVCILFIIIITAIFFNLLLFWHWFDCMLIVTSCIVNLVVLVISLAGYKLTEGGCGGWTPTGKQITPLQTPGKKARGVGFWPPLGLIPANAFIMISIVFHYLYLSKLSVFINCFVLFLCSFLPCDAMHKRGLCCQCLTVCLSVRHVRWSRQNE